MNENQPQTTFRGLPLTPEQDSEIRHYIHVRTRNGVPWDTPELQAMLDDMLDPPELGDEDGQSLGDSMASEYYTATEDGILDTDFVPGHEPYRHHA
jgi:hypothetical protein